MQFTNRFLDATLHPARSQGSADLDAWALSAGGRASCDGAQVGALTLDYLCKVKHGEGIDIL